MRQLKLNRVSLVRLPSFLPVFFSFIIPPLLWAGNYIIGRAIRDDIPPITLTFTRWFVALLIILPFAFPYMRRDMSKYLRYPTRIVAISLSGVAAFSLLVYYGLHHTSGTNALLLNSCVPVLIMLFSALFFGTTLSLIQMVGLLVSCCGVLTIVFKGDLQGLLQMTFSSGDLLLLAAMACFALFTLWQKKLPEEINRTGLLGIQVIITILAVFPLWLMETRSGVVICWTPSIIEAVVFLGIFPSFLAYLLYVRCVQVLGAARASLSIHLIPVYGVVLSASLLGEKIHLFHLAGITTILAGVCLASYESKRKQL